MNDIISKNVKSIEISGIRKFYNKVAEVPNALSLTLGQPDFKVPHKIKEAMIRAINEDKTVYTSNAGIVELRKEICSYLGKMDIKYAPEEVCITIGGSEALLSVFTALLNPGDKVLVFTPVYPAYESCVKILGGVVLDSPLKSDFTLDLDKLENTLKAEKPKVMVLSFPSNPTGAILTKEDCDRLYEIVKSSDTIIISDEMYSSLCFEEEYFSIAQHSDLLDRIIYVNGFSKMFSMTGLRLGYVCAQEKFMKEILKVHQYNVSCAPSISQYGALEGLKTCMDDVEFMKTEFIRRRDYVYSRLKNMGIEVNMPRGAFYIFPSIKKFHMTSQEFCERLLLEQKVAVVPGSAFGKEGEGYVRISYCYSMDVLEQCLNRIESFINTI